MITIFESTTPSTQRVQGFPIDPEWFVLFSAGQVLPLAGVFLVEEIEVDGQSLDMEGIPDARAVLGVPSRLFGGSVGFSQSDLVALGPSVLQ